MSKTALSQSKTNKNKTNEYEQTRKQIEAPSRRVCLNVIQRDA